MRFWSFLKPGASIVTKRLNAVATACIDMIADLLMLMRWAREGWEVHP